MYFIVEKNITKTRIQILLCFFSRHFRLKSSRLKKDVDIDDFRSKKYSFLVQNDNNHKKLVDLLKNKFL
jgi:hypothetical protein